MTNMQNMDVALFCILDFGLAYYLTYFAYYFAYICTNMQKLAKYAK
jgi:hypothetical protein